MKKKFRIKKRFLMVCLLIFTLCMFIKVYIHQEKLINDKNNSIKNVENLIEKEKKINEQLKDEKNSINSPEVIERMARDKLGMIRPGEKVYVDNDEK